MKYSNYTNWKNWKESEFGITKPGSKFHYDQLFKGKLKKGSKILEIGYGNGELLAYFKSAGHLVLGVELNIHLDERSKKNGYTTYCGNIWDVSELKFNKFDLIVAFAVVEHMNYIELNKLFIWFNEHLNDEGLIYLKFPEGASPLALGYQNGDFTHVTCLTETKILSLCQSTNMKLQTYCDEALVSNKLCSYGFIGKFFLIILQYYAIIFKLLIKLILFPLSPSIKLSTNSIAIVVKLK
jgi:hypothetical protein